MQKMHRLIAGQDALVVSIQLGVRVRGHEPRDRRNRTAGQSEGKPSGDWLRQRRTCKHAAARRLLTRDNAA